MAIAALMGVGTAVKGEEVPSLDLNFDGQASSYTRATTSPTAAKANGDQLATSIVTQNKSGTVQSKYMGPNGKLVNGYVTNLVPQSTGTSLKWPSSNWTSTGFTGPAGEWGYNENPAGTNLSFVAAPDGTNTAVRFEKPATTYSVARLFMGTTAGAYTCADGATQTVSFWIRNRLAASGHIYMEPYADSSGNGQSPFYTQSDMPKDVWVRLSYTFTNSSGSTLGTNPARSAWDIEFETNAAHDFDLWGLQIEAGAAASQYVSSTASPAQVPRVEYDASGNALGLLVEEARTNLLYPSAFPTGTSGVWSAPSQSTAVVGATGPDGTNSAATLTANSLETALDVRWRSTTSQATSTTYTLSFFAKAGTSPYVYARNLANSNVFAWWDVTDFSVSDVGTNVTASGSEPVGNGWYRCYMTAPTAATITNNLVDIGIVETSGSFADTNTANRTGIFWGAQLEQGEGATSYIPNTSTSSTATRAADDITLATSAFGYNTAANTVLADFTIRESSLSLNAVYRFDDGSNNNNDVVYYDTALTKLVRQTKDGGTSTPYDMETALSPPFSRIIAARNDGTAARDAIDGTLGSLQTVVAPSTPRTTLYLGRSNLGNMTGHIRRLTYWPRAINDAQLSKFTNQ